MKRGRARKPRGLCTLLRILQLLLLANQRMHVALQLLTLAVRVGRRHHWRGDRELLLRELLLLQLELELHLQLGELLHAQVVL